MKTILAVSLALILRSATAWAVLGEYESSVSLDQEALRGELRQETRQGYKFHQITSANGTVVREYVSPAGLVFGIAWQGPFMPNLLQLLGSSFNEVQAARSGVRRHGGPLVVRTDKLVLVSGGHMRSYHGRAYVPSLVPTNVSAEVVR